MKRKKKIRIAAAVILGTLMFIVIGGYIWYINSPFATITKLMSAVKEKDVDKVIECIEPETAQKLQLIMNFTGIASEDFIDRITEKESDKEIGGSAIRENTSVKFSDYSREGNQAYITLTVMNEAGEENIKEIKFVRVHDTWYLSLEMS